MTSTVTADSSSVRRVIWAYLIYFGAALATFSPVLHATWLWDDPSLILNNLHLRSWAGLGQIWLDTGGSDYWPMTYSLFWVEWNLFGNAPVGYHLVHLFLHLGNAFLFWKLLGKLGLRWGWLGGLLFLIHPLMVETVAWVSETKNTLAQLFLLLSFLAYLDSREKPGRYRMALLYFLVALLAKTSVVTVPLVLLLYHFWRDRRLDKVCLLRLAPFFLLSLVFGWLTYVLQTAQPVWEILREKSLTERLVSADTALYFYLGKFFWPFRLMPIYPHWPFPPYAPGYLLLIPLLLIFITGLFLSSRVWARHVLFGYGFFALSLLPVLGLVRFVYERISPVADHFMYLPILGLIGLTVAGLEDLHQRLSARPWLVPALVSGLVLVLAWKSHGYTEVFSSERNLWFYVLERNSTCKEAQNQVGLYEFQAGHREKAKRYFQEALRLCPTYSLAHNNLGYVLELEGQFAAARAEYQAALRVEPNHGNAQANLKRIDCFETFTPVIVPNDPRP